MPPCVIVTSPPERSRFPDPLSPPPDAVIVTSPVDVLVIGAFKITLPSATSVRVVVPPAAISAETVMVPLIEPLPAVLTVTLPDSRAADKVAAESVAATEDDDDVYVPEPKEMSASALSEIEMSRGSTSQVPYTPAGATVSTSIPSMSRSGPEVSMRPPSPPNRPPRALSEPWTTTRAEGFFGSAHSTMVPPSPS